MISKLGVGILTAAALLIAVPSNAFAASSSADKAKLKKYSKQLSKLPNLASPASKVYSLVTKCSKLDPKKANKYYKTGLKKLIPGSSAGASATKIALAVGKIVKKSGLPDSTIAKVQKQVTKTDLDYGSGPATPTPTPTSPTAMLSGGVMTVA